MLFPTTDFAVFFAIVFLAHWLLKPATKQWKVFMILASYLFYAWWDPRFVWLLAGVSALAELGGIVLWRTESERRRRLVLVISVTVTLLPLAYFKYYSFFTLNLANALDGFGIGSAVPLLQIVLPVGISFFTFMAISYIIDIYRRELEPVGWLDFFLYLSFFPHLVAGPIVRGEELIPQLQRGRDPRRVDFSRGAWLVLGGLFKKIVVSSYVATTIVDPVFADPGRHASLEVLIAIYGYAVVIYADFSGYTDIAIGVALLLGYRFPENFNRPYSARSLQDFWRRWHMTLSRWLRDYLYIPLGGSRGGEVRTHVNIVLTMVLGGLWHGAAWTFVVWATMHGMGQAVGHLRRTRRIAKGLSPQPNDPGSIARQRIVTFHLVCLGWVFFRADSLASAFDMLARLATGWAQPAALVSLLLIVVIAGMIGLQWLPGRTAGRVQIAFSRMAPAIQGVVLALALFVITTLGPQGVAPFIYFQF
ncbi:MAG: MBOAT family O-acyltransferase [Actinomycetota bacterium]